MTSFRLVCPILASIALFTFVGRANADAGLPPPQLDINLAFKSLDQFPNYDFYLKYEHGFPGQKNGKPHLDQIEADKPTHLGGRRSGLSSVFLIAVPRGQAVVAPAKHEPDWLAKAPSGGLQSAALKADAAGAPLQEYSGYDITYRVQIAEDRLEVEWVESNLNEWWSNARLIGIAVGAACVLIPLTIIALVVLLIVRWTRRGTAASDAH